MEAARLAWPRGLRRHCIESAAVKPLPTMNGRLMQTEAVARREPAPASNAPPTVEIAVPVYDEAPGLEIAVRRLHSYLSERFPFSWRIVIVDNASTGDTLGVARRLAAELNGLRLLHLDRKGRGLALRTAWITSDLGGSV